MNEYDTSVVLMNIKELQKNRGMHLDNAITSIHIRLKNYDDAPKAIAALQGCVSSGSRDDQDMGRKAGTAVVSRRSGTFHSERAAVPDHHTRRWLRSFSRSST